MTTSSWSPGRSTEWHWIERFREQFDVCGVRPGEPAVVLCETASRPVLVETARLALGALGAQVAVVELTTPPNRGPVPIRSTGASVALQGNQAAVAACAAAGFVADCTVEGLLHAPELDTILQGGARVLMVSNEHPEVFDRLPHDPDLRPRVEAGVALLEGAGTMHLSSPHGTDLTVRLDGAVRAGSYGWTTEPGTIAHWPGGLVLCFPAAGTTDGRLVMAPGDVNLTFKQYVRSPVALVVEADYVVAVEGDGLDAELFRSYLAAWGDREAYAVSHVGWGMNPACRWDALPLYDKGDINGTELRAFAGNALYSTGANEVAGRFTRGHFDLPLRHHTVTLDGRPVVVDGHLQPPLTP
jgi:2,5-dihydroxypyridine 5,6-dioxygenase